MISKFIVWQGRGRGAYKCMVKESDADIVEIYNKKSVRLLFAHDVSDCQRYLMAKNKGYRQSDSLTAKGTAIRSLRLKISRC